MTMTEIIIILVAVVVVAGSLTWAEHKMYPEAWKDRVEDPPPGKPERKVAKRDATGR